MQTNQTIRSLEDFGLSEKEAMTYLASLELGPAPVQDIAGRAKLTRPTAHIMVEALVQRGLMKEERHGKRRLLKAASPQRLGQMVASEKGELERQEKATADVIAAIGTVPNSDDDIDVQVTDRDVADGMLVASCARTERPVCVAYNLAHASDALIITPEDEIGAALTTRHLLKTVVQETATARLTDATAARLALPGREIGAALVIVDDELYFSGATDSGKCLFIRNVAIATTMRTMFDAFYDESRQQ